MDICTRSARSNLETAHFMVPDSGINCVDCVTESWSTEQELKEAHEKCYCYKNMPQIPSQDWDGHTQPRRKVGKLVKMVFHWQLHKKVFQDLQNLPGACFTSVYTPNINQDNTGQNM